MLRLKDLRKGTNTSQLALSKALGVSRSTIAMWEAGASQPDNELLIKIATHFHVSVDYLLGREDNKKAPVQMDEGDELDRQIMDLFKQLTPEDKQKIIDFTAWSIERQDDGQK